MVQIKDALAGRYELTGILGRGGMGVVYRATDRILSRTVAVKVLAIDTADDPSLVARFEREALAAAALSHPNIVAVYDTGYDADTHYIVMECVPGASLAELLRARGRLSPAVAVPIAARIASALAAAHRAGIVHRDIKPANVMVDDAGGVRVLDFGIARMAASTLTRTAMILGSPPYLSPEVALGRPADERSDIYSLGCVLYEMLTGSPPFTGELPAAVIQQHHASRARSPRELSSAVPARLDSLVVETLAKDPRKRPQRAEQLERALGASLEDDPAPALPRRATDRAQRAVPQGRRLRSREAIALVVAVLIVAAGLAVLLQGSTAATHQSRAAIHRRKPSAHRAALTHGSAQPPKPASSRLTTTASSPPVPTTPSTSQSGVPAAIQALTALVARDLQSGQIDPHAADQIEARVRSANGGADSVHGVRELSTRVAKLAGRGEISATAFPAVMSAVDVLLAALERSGQSHPASAGEPD